MTALASRLAAVARQQFAPVTRLTASQWADRHGWIARSSGASESGPYSTERVPYMREILDVMGDETHRDVVFNKPAQVGFTEALNQFVGYCMAADPSGVIVIQPDIEMSKAWMKERIDPMLAESRTLRGIVRSEGGRRTSDDTMQRKVFPGGWLVALGANSPSKLRSRPARRVLGDERSGWTLDARAQGDPWDLAGERTTTFWNAKRIQGSTPGEEGVCPITAALAESDLRRYHVACPACGKREPFQWQDEMKTFRLVCERDAAGQLVPESARYLCTGCGVLIPESEKPRMLRGGQWIAEHPERETAGFDLNGLISPWRTWAEIARMWRDLQGNVEKLKVFVTHVLAEPWRAPGERIDVHTLMERVEPLAEAPEPVAFVTGSVDVQAKWIETLRVGWAAEEEGYIFDWRQHEGDPTQDDPWDSAWEALNETWGAPLRAVAVDTGFLTDEVWKRLDRWSMNGAGIRVFGIKGEDGRGRKIMEKPTGTRRKGRRPPWIVGSDAAKDALQLRLLRPVVPGELSGAGALHFADTLDAAFFDQLTSEELKTALVKGRPTKVWRLIKGRRNEALDLLIYALAALHGLERLSRGTIATLGATALQRVAAQHAAAAARLAAEETQEEAPEPRDPAPIRGTPTRGGFVNAWRRGLTRRW